MDSAPRGRLFGFEESPAANLRTADPVDFGQRPFPSRARTAVPDVVPGASCEPEIDFVQNPSPGASDMKRSLAIEELGTSFQVEKRVPLVRLKGHWLKAAGFTAGKRVTVTCLSPGVMELRAETVSATLNLILGGAPEGKPACPARFLKGAAPECAGSAEVPTGSAIPAGLAPGLDCARWLQAGSLGGSERNPLGHSQGFPLGNRQGCRLRPLLGSQRPTAIDSRSQSPVPGLPRQTQNQ